MNTIAMDYTRYSRPLAMLLVLWATTARAQFPAHSDIDFRYGTEQIEVVPHEDRLVFAQVMPEAGFFRQANANPGFFSERDLGGGTGPSDVVSYNVLDNLLFWSDGEFATPADGTEIRIINNPGNVDDTHVGRNTGEQLAEFDPLTNSIGQSSSSGDFHAHVDFRLEPFDVEPDEGPAFGAYGMKLSLASDNPAIDDSAPFFIVFRFGMEPELFADALDDFAALLDDSPSLLGDFDDSGLLDARDIDLLGEAIRLQQSDAVFDVNGDSVVSSGDREHWVQQLVGTSFGDADLDGSVQFADFLALSNGFGKPGGWANGDFDGSGDVQFGDFLLLSANFGRSNGAAGKSAAASVPEPRTPFGLAVAGLLVVLRRRRGRSVPGREANGASVESAPAVGGNGFRVGFTLVELLVVIAIIAMLVGLLLPAVQAARSSARKTQCTNHLRQLALAFQTHHDAIGWFPISELASQPAKSGRSCVGGMYSWHARILPYIEEQPLFESIDFKQTMSDNCTSGESGYISQSHVNARAAATPVAVFLCPSDGATGQNDIVIGSANPASDNYAANAGWPTASTGVSGNRNAPLKYNGLVSLQNPSQPDAPTLARSPVRIRHVQDGLSKTAAISERLIQTATDRTAILDGDERLQSFHLLGANRSLEQMAARCDSTATHADPQHSAFLGRAWISGWSPTGATYRHLKLPNTTNCHFGHSFTSGEFAVTPSSDHVGGVNVAMGDGHVEFITDDVTPTVWWALGNRNDGVDRS